MLTSSKLIMSLLVLVVQIKARNNSKKLKKEIIQTVYLLYQHSKITKKPYNNLIQSL